MFIEKTAAETTAAAAKPSYPDWRGKFWNAESELHPERAWGCEDPPAVLLRNAFTKDEIEAALAVRPDAEALLARAAELWDANLPADGSDSALAEFYRNRESARHAADPMLDHDGKPRKGANAYMAELRQAREAGTAGQRDWRLHIVDSAALFVAFAETADPGSARISAHGREIRMSSRSAAGLPKLRVGSEGSGYATNRYWMSPAFRRHCGRGMRPFRSVAAASLVLADMASQGHRKAFLKGLSTKSGTWVVDLDGVDGPAEACARIARVTFPEFNETGGFLVQEFLPFTAEQRFFVVGGKVVASVCSHRPFCALDAREGRRLDDRVALIERPARDEGAYDRGYTSAERNPALAAAFARKARAFAADAAGEGAENYVIDVGLSDKGIHVIETNELSLSGPYCLDYRWLFRAFNRRQRAEGTSGLPAAAENAILHADAESVATALARRGDLAELLLSVRKEKEKLSATDEAAQAEEEDRKAKISVILSSVLKSLDAQ